jgi:predicted Ser/Thr protein kinase
MIPQPLDSSQSHSPDCPDGNAIGALVEGKLGGEAGARITAHLDACTRCQDLVAFAIRAAGSIAFAPDVRPTGSAPVPSGSGDTIGRYRIVDRIGAGAMGVVYRAIDPTLDRPVALKLVRDRSAASRDRLEHEARLAARLQHPNVVTIYDAGAVDDDDVFVAMEYVEGTTLAEWLRTPHPQRELLDVFRQAARGLSAAHAAGLVHRDFKPSNVLVGRDGRVRVADFGLARHVDEARRGPELALGTPSMASEASATRPGALIGSPRYMAPEQHRGQVADAGSDQFAFCVALYEAVYAERPFHGETLDQLAAEVIGGRLVPPRRGHRVSGWLRDVILRGLSVDPGRRFASMDQLAAVLDRGRRTRRLRLAVAIAGAIAVVVAGGWQLRAHRRTQECRDRGAQVRALFDDDAATTTRRAFAAAGVSFATSSADRATTLLREYTGTLADRVDAACRADEPAPLAGARARCFDDRIAALRTVVRSFEHADAALVHRAVEDVWAAYDRAPCADDVAVLASARSARPLSPEQVEKLGEAAGLLEAGLARDGIAVAEPVLAAAKASGDGAGELAASLRLAQLNAVAGQNAVAVPLLHRAVTLAETLGLDQDAAEAYSLLAGDLDQHADAAARHRYIELARAKLARSGRSGGALEAKLALLEEQLLRDEFKFPDAESAGRRAVDLATHEFGPDHPTVGMAYGELGITLRALGRARDELDADRHATEILERALGADHPTTAGAQLNLAGALAGAGQLDEARQVLVRADQVFTQALGANHPVRGHLLAQLAEIDKQQHQLDAARKELDSALAIVEHTSGPDSVDAGDAHMELAEVIAAEQRYAEALAEAERSVHILETALGRDHPHVVNSLLLAAELQLELGHAADAVPLAERAVANLAGHPENELAEPRMILARALWDGHGDRSRARALAGQARSAQGELGGITRDQIDTWLAQHADSGR